MDYIQVNFRIIPNNDINRDILISLLGNIGFESFAENDPDIEAYIPSPQFNEQLILKTNLLKNIKHLNYSYSFFKIPDQNWNEVWEKNYFKPILIEDRCLIRAPFHHDYPEAQYEIIIEPKMSFGTGNHETTYLMITEILTLELKGKRVLDIGCGTGVLGILASLMGADLITAMDIDKNACNAAIENAKLNHIINMEVKLGNAGLLSESCYDIILANIQRNVILEDLQRYTAAINPGGIILLSGFYHSDLEAIKKRSIGLGLMFLDYKEKNNWVSAKFMLQ